MELFFSKPDNSLFLGLIAKISRNRCCQVCVVPFREPSNSA